MIFVKLILIIEKNIGFCPHNFNGHSYKIVELTDTIRQVVKNLYNFRSNCFMGNPNRNS